MPNEENKRLSVENTAFGGTNNQDGHREKTLSNISDPTDTSDTSEKTGVKDGNARKHRKQGIPDTNHRALIMPPDYSEKSGVIVAVGYLMRFAVIMLTVFGLVFFVSNAFRIGEPTLAIDRQQALLPAGKIFLYSFLSTLFFTLIFSLMYASKKAIIPCLATTAALGALAFFKLPIADGVITYYNAALQRLIDAKYYGFIKYQIEVNNSSYTKQELLNTGAAVICAVFALALVPFLIKRITIPGMIVPLIAVSAPIAVVLTYNIPRSNWAFAFLIAALCGVVVMFAYDRVFSKPKKWQREDAEALLRDRELADPKEERKHLKAERKLEKKAEKQKRSEQSKKERAEAKERKAAERDARRNGKKTSAEEKRELELKKRNARDKKSRELFEAKEKKKSLKKALGNTNKRENTVTASRCAAGGFAAFATFLVIMIALVIPAASIEKQFVSFKSVEERLEKYREYITALLRGDDPVLDLLDYANEKENFEPRDTQAKKNEFTGETVFEIDTQYNTNIYLRGWIGVDYKDGSWLAVDEETLNSYRSLFGTNYTPKETVFKNFYDLMIPGIFDNSDYVSRYYAFRNYGFVAMQVNIKRNKTNSMYTYFPAFYDSSLGLRDYGSEEKSKMTYVNFFDGIYTGRAFKNESEYATVSYVTTQKKSDWYKNVAELIAKYNLNKSLIEEYKKDPEFDVSPSMPDDTEDGEATEGVVGYADNTYLYEIFKKYRNEMTAEERSSIDYLYYVDRLYNDFVYNTYLGFTDSPIFDAALADVINRAAGSEKDPYALNTVAAAERNSTSASTYEERHLLVMAIIDWMCDNFEYTLDPTNPSDPSLTGIENFISTQKQGYCVQFASTAAVLLRKCGIPTRYVEGYVLDNLSYNRGYLKKDFRYSGTVKDKNAHAWIEVWFDGVGWIQYECVPIYYDGMYTDGTGTTPSNPSVDPGTSKDNKFESEYEYLYDIQSMLSGYNTSFTTLETEFARFFGWFTKNERNTLATLKERYDDYYKRYEELDAKLEEVVSGKITKEELAEYRFIPTANFLYNEAKELAAPINNLLEMANYYDALYDRILRISAASLAGIIVLSAVLTIVLKAHGATKKNIKNTEKLINGIILPDDRRDTAVTLIDKTNKLLKLYGSAPHKGEFRDEYAKRLSLEYEPILGHAAEYDVKLPIDLETDDGEDTEADTNGTEYGETDAGVIPVAISDEDLTFKEKMLEKLLRAGSKDAAEEKKLMKKLKRKGRKKKETPVSDVRIGKILDSVAAEEFGGQMSEEEIKTLAKLYLTLYKSSIRKLPFPKWLVCHYFGHRV